MRAMLTLETSAATVSAMARREPESLENARRNMVMYSAFLLESSIVESSRLHNYASSRKKVNSAFHFS